MLRNEMPLHFQIPASKSILNRALIAQSFFPALKLHGDSKAQDVVLLRQALAQLSSNRARGNKQFEVGLGGTTFRFLALRLSRETGTFKIAAEPHLLLRPQQDLQEILQQLGVNIKFYSDHVVIESQGWRTPSGPLRISQKNSTQFASALLLNAWNLNFNLQLDIHDISLSEGYWEMSLQIARQLGMKIENWLIPAGQTVTAPELQIESDMSSAFAIAAVAAVSRTARLSLIPTTSMQPDFIFIEVLQKMGVSVSRLSESQIEISQTRALKSIQMSLKNSPDLFPVLAVLCAGASGVSKLIEAPQLVLKESDRLKKMSELLQLMQIPHEKLVDGMLIQGGLPLVKGAFVFDAETDHRLVMAAVVAQKLGYSIQILNESKINKSFPEFLDWSRGSK